MACLITLRITEGIVLVICKDHVLAYDDTYITRNEDSKEV